MTKKILLILCFMATFLAFGFSQNVMAQTASQQTNVPSDQSVSSNDDSFDNQDYDDSEDFGDDVSDQLPEGSPSQSSTQTQGENPKADED